MLRLLADENFNHDILRGLWRVAPNVDVVIAQQVGLGEQGDPAILAWAADADRVVLSHDINTMVGFAWQRVDAGQKMPGLLIVPKKMAIGAAVAELELIVQATEPSEWLNQVRYLPLS